MENIFPQKRELSGDGKYWKKEADIAREKVKELEERNKVLEDALQVFSDKCKGILEQSTNFHLTGKEYRNLIGAIAETIEKIR